jgi:O-succinylbenzoate synthase
MSWLRKVAIMSDVKTSRIDLVRLHRIDMPLVRPFRTSFGTQEARDVLLVEVVSDGVSGWAECVAMEWPGYSAEYVDGAVDVLMEHLIPAALSDRSLDPHVVHRRLQRFQGHPMAKAALETAVLDAWLRQQERSLGDFLGAVRDEVDCGVSVGIPASIDALLDEVASYVAAGYRRIKLKIEPGWDVDAVRAVRETWPDMPLQTDANQAYTRDDTDLLAAMDPYDLLLVEQPLPEDDLRGHALLAERITTPVCLDESIISVATADTALAFAATSVINIKPGRVGGYLEAKAIHDLCRERGVPVWCGGMLETGIGRAANVALAALPGFTLPGDTSASSRYFATDITPPFVLDDGRLRVPTGPGIGVDPIPALLAELTTWSAVIDLR